MNEIDLELQVLRPAFAVRDVVSATDYLLELPPDVLRAELNDIELAHARLSKLISRITNGKTV